MYFIHPQVNPSHTVTLEARLTGVTSFPFVPGGMTISWRQDGALIPGKSGSTDDLSLLRVNTGDVSDFNFDATDSGSVIDFIIDGTTFSNPVVLFNKQPTLIGATAVEDAYSRVSGRPSFTWTFSDLDGDIQFLYQIKLGTSVGGSDIYDSGQVLSSDQSFTLPDTESMIAAGTLFHWRIEVSDGEKTTPTDPDSTSDRVLISSAGTAIVNTIPTVSGIKINGQTGSPNIEGFSPVISWTFSDVDAQVQQSFRVIVANNASLDTPLWDSGVLLGADSSVVYNFNLTGISLSSHTLLHVGVSASDTFVSSATVLETFSISHVPVITEAFVDDKFNPTNLINQRPTFTWTATDEDNDPIKGYELRVSDSDTSLGTDSFIGSIWNTGFISTPEAFEAQLDEDGQAFPGCLFPKDLEGGVKYYFQVRVEDEFASSVWFTGCFKLNDSPVASDLEILPNTPFGSDDLESTWTFSDDDGEGQSNQTEIRWFKNGVEVVDARNLTILPSTFTLPFEEWHFTVRPHDGVEFGDLVTSSTVLISNRPPVAISLSISPAKPKTGDSLEALFVVSDADGDDVTAEIRWYKNGVEQLLLRNQRIVQPIFTTVSEEWYFIVIPNDGFSEGSLAQSRPVTIANTKPEILALTINDKVFPNDLEDPNPTVSWQYLDADSHPQQAFQVVLGTSPFRTKGKNAIPSDAFFCINREDGIVSIAGTGSISSGDEVFDSRVVSSTRSSFQYATEDFVPSISLSAADSTSPNGYNVAVDLSTIMLATGITEGEVFFDFLGSTGTYEAEISLVGTGRKSSYEFFVDGVSIDSITTSGDTENFVHTFKATTISSESKVSIRGRALEGGARAPFLSLTFIPVSEFNVDAGVFDSLNGYASDGNNGIKLAGLAGTASLIFPFPSGSYDIEVVYVTESAGSPSLSISVNNTVVDSFSFQTGVSTRSRFIQNISIITGDTFKLNGSKGGAASARIKKVIFRPTQTLKIGTKLQDGIKYFVSVRVNDGTDWSNWYTTTLSVSGSAWVSSVENATGWTIESRFRLLIGNTDTTASTSESEDSEQSSNTCATDLFQGIRFYDGTAFGWLRLKPDKVELLVDTPLEAELDGTEFHTFRITVKNQDIKLYVDEEVVINAPGGFKQSTQRKMLEFGDIAGRQQTNGSEWESFKYSTSGSFAPNALIDYTLDEMQRFPDASIGRLKGYKDNLYVSVDPNNPNQSSKIFRFEEGFEPEKRSVVALTRSFISSVVVDPNRKTNLFDTSGKFMGTHRGLQYLLGSKIFPFDERTLMLTNPTDNGWDSESTCDNICTARSNGILTIDTTSETGGKFHRFVQRKNTDAWAKNADNERGWTIEARIKISDDGSGSNTIDARSSFVLGDNNQCDPAGGISVGGFTNTEIPEDDGLNAPGILINDGKFQEIVQFFSTGIRLKYANIFAEQDLSDQFYTVRVIGKGAAIAVYTKSDSDRFFKRVLFAPDGLFVLSQPIGDQEKPHMQIDRLGSMHTVYQDSRDGEWGVFYSKTLPENIVARGSGMYSSDFADFEKFVKSRPGFSLPPDSITNTLFSQNTLFSGGASFISWGVKAGDIVIVFSNSTTASPRKFAIRSIDHETIIKVDTEEDLSSIYNGAEYVILRGVETWLPPVQISTQLLDSNNPRMLLTSDTNAFVAYDNTENGSTEIFIRQGTFDPFYMNWGTTVRLTNSVFDSSRPDITEVNNFLIVTWEDSRNDSERSEIFASAIDFGEFGVLDEYPNINVTLGSLKARNPKIVAAGNRIYIAYENDPDADGVFDIFVSELDNTLAIIREVQISSGGHSSNPSIATDGITVTIVYENNVFGAKEIFAVQISNASTETSSFGSPVRITDSRGESELPDVAIAKSGDVIISFQDNRVRQEFSDLYVARYDSNLGQWLSSGQQGLDTKIETYITESCRPSVAVDQFGNIAFAWEAAREGDLKRIARALFNGLPSMDKSVIGYFPLDDDSPTNTVENKYREFRGSTSPPVQTVFVVNQSSEMNTGNRSSDAKSITSSTVAGLSETDQFNIILFNDGTSLFRPDLVLATSDNKAAADAFLTASSPSGDRDLNNAISTAFEQSFSTDGTKTPIVSIVDTGSLDNNSDTTFSSLNSEISATPLVYGVEGADQTVLLRLANDDETLVTFRDSFASLSESFTDFFSKHDAIKDFNIRFDLAIEPQANGTGFDGTNLYHVDPFDSGISSKNPSTQGAFKLDSNGKGFSVPASLLNHTGAVDLWIQPFWDSNDITERVIFGNGPPNTTIANTMAFGVRPAASGNDLFIRCVDELGGIHEALANNPAVGPKAFDWSSGDTVHLRAIWDQNAIGISTLRSVCFPTTTIGYACSEAGIAWKTVDGGKTWVELETNLTYELYSIDFIDSSTGWMAGEFGTVIKTTDGGANWTTITTGVEVDLNGIYFKNSSVGYAVGSEGTALFTSDGGSTWAVGASGTTSHLRDVSLVRSGAGEAIVAVGGNGTIISSTDGGATYSTITSPIQRPLRAVSKTHQAGTYSSYIVGDAGTILKTIDNGDTWTDISFNWDAGFQPNIYGVSHGPDSDFVYMVGQNGRIAFTIDGGTTFTSCQTGLSDGNYRAIEANFGASGDNLTIVTVGAGGTVMRSSDSGTTQIYSITRSGNLCIFMNGIKVSQPNLRDGPFRWNPKIGGPLVFGDYRQNGTHSANASFDELIIYRTPPPNGALFRRKDMWTFQGDEAKLLITENSEKRIEWGDISSEVSTKSFWTRLDMAFCGAKEPVHVFAWDSQMGLVDDVVNDLALDNSGRLWIATEHGITSFDINSANEDISRWLGGLPLLSGPDNRFINYTNIVDGLIADDVTAIAVDSNDNIWAGTRNGLMLLELDEDTFTTTGEDPIDVQRQLDESGQESGVPGSGTFGGGTVVNAASIKFRNFTTEDGMPSNNVISLESIQGAMLIGTDKGLVVVNLENQIDASGGTDNKVDFTKISIFTTVDGLPSNRIQAIGQESQTGNIWVGTDRGLARFFPEGSIGYDTTSGLTDTDIFSITIDRQNKKFVGTGFGITKIDGINFESFQPADGIGFGAVLDGAEDGTDVKWFAVADGLIEIDESCNKVKIAKYGVDDGILGQPGVSDFQRYFILGDDIPSGACDKALINIAVNGVQLNSGFSLDKCVPWVIFDEPRTPSDKVEVCLHSGWRKSHDFSFDPRNPETQSFVQTNTSRFLLYRKRFQAGSVILGGNFSKGAKNTATKMYSVFVAPLIGNGTPVLSINTPTTAVLNASATKDTTSIYSDINEKFTLLAADMVGIQQIALPSTDLTLIDEQYAEFVLSEDAFVYVAYDSRSAALPGWLREFNPVPAVFRVTDMETFTDATEQEKLFMSVSGTIGCVFDMLNDEDVCDISDQIAIDSVPPDGCATIVRLNTSDEAVLSLQAEDGITGVAGMQISAFENFTTDGTVPVDTVPFQTSFNLKLPIEAIDPVVNIEDSSPPDDNPLNDENFPDIEYTIAFEHNNQIILGSKSPGRVFEFNRSTQKVTFLFDTGENEVTSMSSFGNDLIVGTAPNGRAFRWNGTVLSQILIPEGDAVNSIITFNNKVFFGTSPDGKIFTLDQFNNIELFKDTNETSVDGFAIFAGNLFWNTSNDQITEGDILSLTTREGHRHTMTVPAGTDKLSGLNGTTSLVDGHTHEIINGIVQKSNDHTHQVNGSRSGKVFRLDSATSLSTIVHSDQDSFITSIISTSIEQEGLMFLGTFPNGKILRYVPSEGIFIKSFDTANDRISNLSIINGVVYAIAQDEIFFFDGRRWQFFSGTSEETVDVLGVGNDILIVRKDSLGTVNQVQPDGSVAAQEVCAFVKFIDTAGNETEVRDDDGNFVECLRPCITPNSAGLPTSAGDDSSSDDSSTDTSVGGDVDGDGITDNPLLSGVHRIVEVDSKARSVFTLNGPEPFLSGNRIEAEVGVYESEIFNGTTSLVQWESLSWIGSAPTGTSITIAVRFANTSAEISGATYGAEFDDPSENDLTNLSGQFLQFRATLTVTENGIASPQLDTVDIKLRTSQATHYFTTNFKLPDELRRGILTYNGCINPPATDVVFGISGKDSSDFSDYFVITPDKIFDTPSEHQTKNIRVGIKFISSPDQVPVVDEFALLFSLANDAKIRLNLAGQTGTTEDGPIVDGDTTTVVTDKVQGHTHTITFDSTITDEAGINGQTSINAGHSHQVINGIIQQAAGHIHNFSID